MYKIVYIYSVGPMHNDIQYEVVSICCIILQTPLIQLSFKLANHTNMRS